MRVLATSNRISPSGWERIQGQQKGDPVIQQMVKREERVRLAPEKGKNPVPVTGWVQVHLRAISGSEGSEELVFLCNEIR